MERGLILTMRTRPLSGAAALVVKKPEKVLLHVVPSGWINVVMEGGKGAMTPGCVGLIFLARGVEEGLGFPPGSSPLAGTSILLICRNFPPPSRSTTIVKKEEGILKVDG